LCPVSLRIPSSSRSPDHDPHRTIYYLGNPLGRFAGLKHRQYIGSFLEYDHGRRPSTKKYYPEPHHPSVSLMDVQKDFGENERNKGNRHVVELALLGFC
jgi:hypothetical protein